MYSFEEDSARLVVGTFVNGQYATFLCLLQSALRHTSKLAL